MRKFVAAVFAAMLACVTQPAAAQITVEGNGARADGEWGGELGIGYGFGAAGFKLTPIVGALVYAGDNDRYFEDNNGGNPRCRDGDTGRYAKSSYCDNTAVNIYGKVEATYSIPLVATIGAGVRFSERDTTPYGTVAFPITPGLKVKGNIGDGYYALGLRLGL
ncbi:MAG: hypothetical protein PGN12_07395 [Sphingomonas phyllosphaerae]